MPDCCNSSFPAPLSPSYITQVVGTPCRLDAKATLRLSGLLYDCSPSGRGARTGGRHNLKLFRRPIQITQRFWAYEGPARIAALLDNEVADEEPFLGPIFPQIDHRMNGFVVRWRKKGRMYGHFADLATQSEISVIRSEFHPDLLPLVDMRVRLTNGHRTHMNKMKAFVGMQAMSRIK